MAEQNAPKEIVPYISPTLQRLSQGHPDPSPACASCPASMWFATDLLKCFCSRMHVIVWEPAQEPVMVCDGRELAVLAILEAQAAKEQAKIDRKLAWKEAAKEIQLERAAQEAAKVDPETGEVLGEVPDRMSGAWPD